MSTPRVPQAHHEDENGEGADLLQGLRTWGSTASITELKGAKVEVSVTACSIPPEPRGPPLRARNSVVCRGEVRVVDEGRKGGGWRWWVWGEVVVGGVGGGGGGGVCMRAR